MPRRVKRIWLGLRWVPCQGVAGEQVEDPAAAVAAIANDRRLGTMAMDVQPVPGGAMGADQAVGMEQVRELVVATILVHQVEDREVHTGQLPGDDRQYTQWPREPHGSWLGRANHQIGYMSPRISKKIDDRGLDKQSPSTLPSEWVSLSMLVVGT